jgi:hypothetical protein
VPTLSFPYTYFFLKIFFYNRITSNRVKNATVAAFRHHYGSAGHIRDAGRFAATYHTPPTTGTSAYGGCRILSACAVLQHTFVTICGMLPHCGERAV